ncbi:Transposase [Agrobacterium sp. DSM 25558]|nr:Transposase [Agrobacterium sp. DSM 25558]
MGHVPECMVDERIYIQRLKAISITLTGHADELVALHNVLAVQALDNLLYGPHMTIHNRFIRRSRLGVFNPILAELTANRSKSMMIDATHLKAGRSAASLINKDEPKAA